MDRLVPIVRSNSALYRLLDETISTSIQLLIDDDLLDPIQNGPKFEKIVSFLGDYDPEIHEKELSKNLDKVVRHALGTALEALSDLDSAISWYKVGQYSWRKGAHWHSGDILALPWPDRESPPLIPEPLGGNPAGSKSQMERSYQIYLLLAASLLPK